jgi:hypothetical protein
MAAGAAEPLLRFLIRIAPPWYSSRNRLVAPRGQIKTGHHI